MTKANDKKKESETTLGGLMEAVIDGIVSAPELLDEIEQHPEWLPEDAAADTMKTYTKMVKTGQMPVGDPDAADDADDADKKKDDDEEEKEESEPAPDPIPEEPPAIVTDRSLLVSGVTFESLVSEGCKIPPQFLAKAKKKKGKKKESIHEFAAPERQDVIMWARGDAPKRTEEKNPFYFVGEQMFSRKRLIARRDMEEKTAQVLSPNRLDGLSGRHAVLAQKGLRYAGYKVEFVDEL